MQLYRIGWASAALDKNTVFANKAHFSTRLGIFSPALAHRSRCSLGTDYAFTCLVVESWLSVATLVNRSIEPRGCHQLQGPYALYYLKFGEYLDARLHLSKQQDEKHLE